MAYYLLFSPPYMKAQRALNRDSTHQIILFMEFGGHCWAGVHDEGTFNPMAEEVSSSIVPRRLPGWEDA